MGLYTQLRSIGSFPLWALLFPSPEFVQYGIHSPGDVPIFDRGIYRAWDENVYEPI